MTTLPVVQVRRSLTSGAAIHLPPSLAQSLRLDAGQQVSLRFGNRTAKVTVRVTPASEGGDSSHGPPELTVSKTPAERILLPVPLHVHLQKEPGDTLRFGPLVGVLACRRRRASPSGELFLSQTPYFAALVRVGRRNGIPTYVMCPDGFDWESRTAEAWTVGAARTWTRITVPLPDVIYDRVQSRKLDVLKSTIAAKERIQAARIPLFNTGFFDKWDTHQLLRTPGTNHLLPATRHVTARKDIYEFARRYRTIYVKPAGGSLGLGIMVLGRSRGGYRLVHYRKHRVDVLRGLRSPERLWRRVSHLSQHRRYIVQQGLALVRYRGCRFDVRVIVQKETDGSWVVSMTYARVAAPGSLRANLEAGGDVVPYLKVLGSIFGRSARRVARRVQRAAIAVAFALEEQVGGNLGEVGLDIGIDRRGRPWLIEANAKPLRQLVGTPRRLNASILRPLRFARRLAGF